jgi:iron complex outermembrane receptor protein
VRVCHMRSTPHPLHATLCAAFPALIVIAPPAGAQGAPPTPTQLPPVLITGNPLASDGIAVPSTVLTGPGLVLRRGSTLGETLSGLPGVSSSYFGPNANRPVIRGQDGDRIRILNNAGATLDASSLSYDHAVPIDPLVIERVEVLRGPAALLYGGSAIGGVVNAIDNRIPKAAIDGPGGAVELRGGGAARERSAGAVVETGGAGFAIHADAFYRRTDDLSVPEFNRPLEGGGSERSDKVINSASDAKGGALGGSMVWDHGYVGVSVDAYRNDYGTVAEEDVTIDMRRDRLSLAGEWRDLGGPIRTVRTLMQSTDYKHEEIEGGAVATTFKNRGNDGRIEFEHAPWGDLTGVFGLQAEKSDFEAIGDEAFVPSSTTTQAGLFVYEELKLGSGASRLTFGSRIERSRVKSDGDTDGNQPQFGEAQTRRFTPVSAALGGIWELPAAWGGGWQAYGNVAYTERAPTSFELFANGVHVATGAFEQGDPSQSKEKGVNLDVALEWRSGANRLRAGVFASRFSNYIALLATGEPDFIEGGEAFPIYAFEGIKAKLSGVEIEAAWRVIETRGTLDLEAQLDSVRATNRDANEPLPRIAPLRLALGAVYALDGWTFRSDVILADRQDRVPDDDPETAGYVLLNLALSKQLSLGGSDALMFVKLNNLTDQLAFNASSIATVRPLAPLPGRSLSAGLRVSF